MAPAGNMNSITAAHYTELQWSLLTEPESKRRESQQAAALDSTFCCIPTVTSPPWSRPQSQAGDGHRPFSGPGCLPARGGPGILTIFITDFLLLPEVFSICSLKAPAGEKARNVLVNINPQQERVENWVFSRVGGYL